MKSKRSVRDPREGLGRRWGGRVLTVDRDDRCCVDCLHLEGLVDGDPLLGSEHLVLVRHGSSGAGHPHLVEGPGRRHRHVRMHRCGDVVPVGKEKSEQELRERENIIVKTHRTSMPSLELAWALSLPMCSSKRAPLRWLLEEEDAEKAKIKVGFKVRWMRESKERERARRGTHQYWGLQDTLAPRALTLRIRACEL